MASVRQFMELAVYMPEQDPQVGQVLHSYSFNFSSVMVPALNFPTASEMVEKLALRHAIDSLPERERMVILLRFYKNLTQDRVSKVLGVSQVQVSRIERRAVAHLREALTE